jgi:hypothetical protein
MCFITPLCNAAELEFPKISMSDVDVIFESSYLAHRNHAYFLKPYDIPKEIRSYISVFPFYASPIVPELHFLWLRYFASLSYDKPKENEKAKSTFRHALELLETNKQEGSIALWKNAWDDGNPDAYVKLQEVFKEYKDWCKVLSHFPSSESDMMNQIGQARASLEFFFGSVDDSEKLSLEMPYVSLAFARFEEAKLIGFLDNPDVSIREERVIRHMLQGIRVHNRKKWTQEKIGEMFGVSQSSVSNFLIGKPCPTLVQNVRKYYEENPDFSFFEPRKKRGWGIAWSSFFSWGSSRSKKSSTDNQPPLIETPGEKKRD